MPDRYDIRLMPFVRILPVVIAGILAGNAISLPVWIPITLTVLCMAAALGFKDKSYSAILTLAALFMFSASMARLRLPQEQMPKGGRYVMTMHIADTPQLSGRWQRATAIVDQYRPADGQGEWIAIREKAVIRIDSSHHISVGDKLIAQGSISPVGDSTHAGYVRLMYRRGYTASLWVRASDRVIMLPGKAATPVYFASLLQSSADERLGRLNLTPENMDICKAMSTGNRQGLDTGLRESYSRTGTSHLLAVSGLHVGIVAMLINLLLYLLPAFRRGHIVKNIVAIIVIWLYAFMTGLSPSVLRAALMFTGAQIAFASSRRSVSMNILLATAAVMLLVNPNYLYDVSFQLSFTAVLGIMLIYMPLMDKLRSRFKIVNWIWSVIIVGVAASIATAPLVSYYFGRISLIGIFLNPIVIVTANLIVLFSVIWIIAPIGFLNGIFSVVLNFAAGLQNSVIEVASGIGWGSAAVRLTGWQTFSAYLCIAIALILILRKSKNDTRRTRNTLQ